MINDVLFSKFVLNQLAPDEMKRVEKLLLSDKESEAILHTSIAFYESNIDLAKEMLGEDEFNMEKSVILSNSIDRIGTNHDSIAMNKTQNTMNNNLSKHDRQQIEQLVESFHNNEDTNQTFNERLVSFYLQNCPNMTRDDALGIIEAMRNSIELFTNNLSQAFDQGIDSLSTQLDSIGENLPIEKKYELLLNLLALLNTIDAQNFDVDNLSDMKDIDTFRNELLGVKGCVTEEDVEEIKGEIIQAISESSFSVITTINANELLKDVKEGCDLSVYTKKDTIHEILITSSATYIAMTNGWLESEEYENATPEAVAVGVAAGFEELKVFSRLENGDIDDESAWETIKIIGAVVGITLLLVATGAALALTTTATFVGFLALFGDSLLVSIVGGVAAMAVGIQLATAVVNAAEWVFEKGSELLDRIVDTIRTKTLPSIKKRIVSFTQKVRNFVHAGRIWLKSLFSRHGNSEEED